MMTLVLSKPVQAALWLTAVLTALALLKPDGSGVVAAGAPAPQEHASPAGDDANPAAEAPWVRVPEEAWTPPEARQQAALAPPEPASPPVPPPVSMPPPEPTAPDPAMRYLGRLEQDGRSYVFLGTGADPQVVEVGNAIDGLWKVEKVTATQVELRYLPLNQIRFIAVQ
jgi:hypothetical protein